MSDRAKPPFKKILIANRGEIAVRVIHAVHRLGAKAVSVYSDPDESALHVLQSDEAYRIGAGPASESYLNIEAILEAAKSSGAEAVHPGYGFLAENAAFAEAVADAGLVFIGPPPNVIRLMGDKVAAKRLMAESGVALIPGYDGDDQSQETFIAEAARIGYPVMLKAAAGGGGRGMRTVEDSAGLPEALEGARREATGAFGDGRLFLEKLLVGARHIEVQVLGDSHGNLIHLFERDCSLQRRHQKVVEEAPSPALNDGQRTDICDAGVRAARAADYVNAGTVEFLWRDGKFYFLEMNTRVQVEHPVTELVTGRDIVQAQIRIAAGSELEWKQEDIKLEGHAVEARLYAEDPDHGFLPQSGWVRRLDLRGFRRDWRDGSFESQPRAGARHGRPAGLNPQGIADTGIRAGDEVSRFYDPMIAKLITFQASRPLCLEYMRESLPQLRIAGIRTNLDFLSWIFGSSQVVEGAATTSFLEENWGGGTELAPIPDPILLAAVATVLLPRRSRRQPAWFTQPWWRIAGQSMPISLDFRRNSGAVQRVDLSASRGPTNLWIVSTPDRAFADVGFAWEDHRTLAIRTGSEISHVSTGPGGSLSLISEPDETRDTEMFVAKLANLSRPESSAGPGAVSSRSGDDRIRAPMPGSVIKLNVGEGDRVQMHQPLMVIEAMKMEHVIEAPHAGIVKTIHRQPGEVVTGGETLVDLTDEC